MWCDALYLQFDSCVLCHNFCQSIDRTAVSRQSTLDGLVTSTEKWNRTVHTGLLPYNIEYHSKSHSTISMQVILEFTNLTTLYLHGNHICNLAEIKKLSGLPHLRTLTLHGNPIENQEGYRHFVLSTLPTLKQLDFSSVTKQNQRDAESWKKLCSKKMKIGKKKKAE
eukprot:sb/3472442/